MALGFHEANVISLCIIALDGFFFHDIWQLLKYTLNLNAESSAFLASLPHFVSIIVHWLNYFILILSNSCIREDLSAFSCNFWFLVRIMSSLRQAFKLKSPILFNNFCVEVTPSLNCLCWPFLSVFKICYNFLS